MPIPGMENQVIVDSKLLVNMELVRDLTPNSPLRTYDVKAGDHGQTGARSAGQRRPRTRIFDHHAGGSATRWWFR
jgi:hypothetical protein